MAGKRYSRDELLVTFRLYQMLPFGKLHRGNPAVVELAQLLGRTENSVAMKLVNLASFDPAVTGRNRKGLKNASRLDGEIFKEFYANTEALANACEAAMERLTGVDSQVGVEVSQDVEPTPPSGSTEVERVVRARRVQRFFRNAVLSNYQGQCAISGINISELLNASHIIPWAKNVERRADPTNGIALCAIYDRAFDRGLITFDEDYKLVISRRLCEESASALHRRILIDVEGTPLKLPSRARPDDEAMDYHREHVFEDK